MMPSTQARLTKQGGHRGIGGHFGHVARLATGLVHVVTVQPLKVRHLLGKLAYAIALFVQSNGVKLVTCSAERGITNLRTLPGNESAGGGPHNLLVARIDTVRPMLDMLALHGRVNDEVSDEALAVSEILFGNLVAYRAGDAVGSLGIALLVHVEGKMRKDATLLSREVRLVVRHWHVAMRAFVL